MAHGVGNGDMGSWRRCVAVSCACRASNLSSSPTLFNLMYQAVHMQKTSLTLMLYRINNKK